MRTSVGASVQDQDALRYLGHRGQELDANFEEAFHRISAKLDALQAIGVVRCFPIKKTSDQGVELEGTSLVLAGSNIATHLTGATEVALMAVTLGFESERLLKQLSCISATEGIIADACASSMIENAAHNFAQDISEEVKLRNMRCGKRFSPGYGNFPLSIQQEFITAIGADKTLGIKVTEGDLMVPTKSITAVVPIFEDNDVAD